MGDGRWSARTLAPSSASIKRAMRRPRVRAEIQGTISPTGQYGHMGAHHREPEVSRMVSCRPLREDEKVEA